jgi:hypothetical protein
MWPPPDRLTKSRFSSSRIVISRSSTCGGTCQRKRSPKLFFSFTSSWRGAISWPSSTTGSSYLV